MRNRACTPPTNGGENCKGLRDHEVEDCAEEAEAKEEAEEEAEEAVGRETRSSRWN
jgi:hypothetical protein